MQNLAFPVTVGREQVLAEAKKRASKLLGREVRTASVWRRSVDARKRNDIRLVYSVLLGVEEKTDGEKAKKCGLLPFSEPELAVKRGEIPAGGRPAVIGFGPAGMFAALLLAENGCRPLVIERGGDVLSRIEKVENFYRTGKLDPDTNIQFGAGGAGTFSDGKLMTRISDDKCGYVLRKLYELGAPEDILTEAKPHVGTDCLRAVVANARDRVRALGGEILFDTRFEGLRTENGKVTAIETSAGSFEAGCVILAIGHSARDTRTVLRQNGMIALQKPFSVGVRIEHLQTAIDEALYGGFAGHPALGHAEYALSRRVGDEAVYTFCMCPGGEVMAATSEIGGVVTNGMSNRARSGRNANAALVVSVAPENGEAFQIALEKAAYLAGGGGYTAPAQTVGDYLACRAGTLSSRIEPTYKHGDVRPYDLNGLFPAHLNEMLRLGLSAFDRQIPGFAAPDAILTGAETRTSSPIRFPRDPDTFLAEGFSNLYPAGEGAGYAGGITSAAVDGLRCALAAMEKYRF